MAGRSRCVPDKLILIPHIPSIFIKFVDLHLPISAIPSVHTRKGYVVGKDAHMRDQPETVQRRVMNLGTLKRVKNPNAALIIRIKTLAQQYQPQ